ncbi:MAG: hypothetical protein CMN58_05880 [Solibacterales bacterium]|nr:hypothetical protein [Bryobacterales bacterium]|tara:strand:- start:16228 stop:17277 length:1050 start_codon:yes stop_codon:yes gene_type:complete
MRKWVSKTAIVRVFVVVFVLSFSMSSFAQTSIEGWSVPRTAWGNPDLQGVWDFRTITPMERPAGFDNQVLTDQEVAEFEAASEAQRAALDVETPFDTVGNYNQFWFDPGNAVVDTKRTSLVVDPPDGRIPRLTEEAEQRRAAGTEAGRGQRRHTPTAGGFVEDLGPGGVQVRCILGFNSGPPMTPGGYNQNMQIFQTEDHVVILNEMIHDARIVPMDGRPHLSKSLRQWTGNSRGHWDGDTLVVETTNFLRETAFQGGLTGQQLKLVERFTAVSPKVLLYEVTVEDSTVWTSPWTYQIPMQRNDYPLYEYACHEGNYGLYNILAGAQANPDSNLLTPEEAAEEAARRSR